MSPASRSRGVGSVPSGSDAAPSGSNAVPSGSDAAPSGSNAAPPGSDAAPPGVCFDATGTLIEARHSVGEVYHRVALDYGIDLPAWRLDDAFARVMRAAPPRGTGGETAEARREREVEWWFERIRQTFQATDSTARFPDFPAFARALFDCYRSAGAWRLRPGLAEVVAALRTAGCPLCVVSNFDHRLPEILEHLDLSRFFDHIEAPFRSGHIKPERVVFEAAGDAIGRTLGELVYLGDDAPETLEEIAGYGIRCLDVRTVVDPRDIIDFVLDPHRASSISSSPPSPSPSPSPSESTPAATLRSKP